MKVFYRPELSVDIDSFSPSSRKPSLVIPEFITRFGGRIDITSFSPLEKADFYAAHDKGYVDDVFSLEVPNGFGSKSAQVVNSLRYTNGSIVAAAEYAFLSETIACSPTSGFHHARWAYGGGFCTFNGLIIAALRAMQLGAKKVAIIDCDFHYGDGTDNILSVINKPDIKHFTYGKFYDSPSDYRAFISDLETDVTDVAEKCDLILYQAGADPHIDDPLGGFLTTDQMAERDSIVFEIASDFGVPLVWNFAGGYQDPVSKVVDLHVQTMGIALNNNW